MRDPEVEQALREAERILTESRGCFRRSASLPGQGRVVASALLLAAGLIGIALMLLVGFS